MFFAFASHPSWTLAITSLFKPTATFSASSYSTSAYNYTKWWLSSAYLGLSLKTVVAFGILFAGLFFAGCLFTLGRLSLTEGGLAGLALISPNVMAVIERANADEQIFLLLVLAIAFRRFIPLSTACIGLAAILKIYPAAAFLAFISHPWRKALPWLLVALAVLALDTVTSLGELRNIGNRVTRVSWFSYGSTTMMEGYSTTLPPETYPRTFLIGSLLFLAVTGLANGVRPDLKSEGEWERELFAFRIGASLYVGTFALGSNFDYRTILLLFCLPLLFRMRRESGSAHAWATSALSLIVFYLCFRFVLRDYVTVSFVLKQMAAWALVFVLTGIFAGSIPWLQTNSWLRIPSLASQGLRRG